MRIREGEFAYDIEPVNDPSTMLFKHFRVRVDRIAISGDEKLFEGTAKSFEEARQMAEKKVEELAAQKTVKKAS